MLHDSENKDELCGEWVGYKCPFFLPSDTPLGPPASMTRWCYWRHGAGDASADVGETSSRLAVGVRRNKANAVYAPTRSCVQNVRKKTSSIHCSRPSAYFSSRFELHTFKYNCRHHTNSSRRLWRGEGSYPLGKLKLFHFFLLLPTIDLDLIKYYLQCIFFFLFENYFIRSIMHIIYTNNAYLPRL